MKRSAQSTAPAWVYLLNAVGIFVYQVASVRACAHAIFFSEKRLSVRASANPTTQRVRIIRCTACMQQTLDALDGKQARRTGSSSSFGELFDHGCDAVSAILGTAGEE